MSRAFSWLLPHGAAAAVATLAGMGLGAWLGAIAGAHDVAGAMLGALAANLGTAAVHALRGGRLVEWLRAGASDSAPRGRGLWGELGYRTERALRLEERATALERSRLAQFLSGIEASPNGVLLLDADDRIQWCNAHAAQHFGLDPERDIAQHATNLIRAPAFVAAMQAAPPPSEAVALPLPSGGTLSVLLRPYGDGLKLVLSQDVTERERTEAMRRDFVANVSHEIRTPLTVLAGFLETLVDLPLGEADRRRVLELMGQQTRRMQALVADLLTLAQLEGSPRPAPDQWVALGPILGSAQADALALSAGRHRISLPPADDVEVAGSASELQSAVGNLLNNAVRYTPEGGRIDVGWRWRDDGSGVLEVSDTGIGIAREHLSRLTERFYRVDGSRSRDTGGTGLGLAIVKHVAQRHGGEIQVESEPGKGSRFRIVLPALRVRRKRPPQRAPLAA